MNFLNWTFLTGVAAATLGVIGYAHEARAYYQLREQRQDMGYDQKRYYYRWRRNSILLNAGICLFVAAVGAFVAGLGSV